MNIGTRTQFGWKQGRKLELRVIELLALERALSSPSSNFRATRENCLLTLCCTYQQYIVRVLRSARVRSRTSMCLIRKRALHAGTLLTEDFCCQRHGTQWRHRGVHPCRLIIILLNCLRAFSWRNLSTIPQLELGAECERHEIALRKRLNNRVAREAAPLDYFLRYYHRITRLSPRTCLSRSKSLPFAVRDVISR